MSDVKELYRSIFCGAGIVLSQNVNLPFTLSLYTRDSQSVVQAPLEVRKVKDVMVVWIFFFYLDFHKIKTFPLYSFKSDINEYMQVIYV